MRSGDKTDAVGDFLLVDGGTTNTRVHLVKDGRAVASVGRPVGVRNTAMEGNNRRLVGAVTSAIRELGTEGVDRCLCAGIITSPLGLMEVPHIPAPASAEELARGIRWTHLPELTGLAMGFVPGVRTLPGGFDASCSTPDMLAQCDLMRGEETQTMGLARLLGRGGVPYPFLAVILGSHTKFILVDGDGRIAAGLTTLAGELMEALRSATVLAGSLPGEPGADRVPDFDAVDSGAAMADGHGFSRTAFTVRLADQLYGWPRERCHDYLSGAIAATDIHALGGWGPANGVGRVFLLGNPYRVSILKHLLGARLALGTTVSDEYRDMTEATVAGAIGLMELVANGKQGENSR